MVGRGGKEREGEGKEHGEMERERIVRKREQRGGREGEGGK